MLKSNVYISAIELVLGEAIAQQRQCMFQTGAPDKVPEIIVQYGAVVECAVREAANLAHGLSSHASGGWT